MNFKVLINLTFWVAITFNVFSQTRSLVIADNSNKAALPFATVKILNQNYGFHSDSNGVVKIQANQTDTLLIEYSGYFSLRVKVETGVDSFFLIRKAFDLDPVVVTSLKKRHNVGTFKYKKNFSINISNSKEYALKIDLSGIEGNYKVNQIFLPIEFDAIELNKAYCKLHLYNANENGEPSEDLLAKPIIIDRLYHLDKDFCINISGQNLILSEKTLFIGVECITNQKSLPDSLNNISEKKSPKYSDKKQEIKLFCAGRSQFFDTSFNHSFFRLLDSKHYIWVGSNNSIYPPSFSAGLSILSYK